MYVCTWWHLFSYKGTELLNKLDKFCVGHVFEIVVNIVYGKTFYGKCVPKWRIQM